MQRNFANEDFSFNQWINIYQTIQTHFKENNFASDDRFVKQCHQFDQLITEIHYLSNPFSSLLLSQLPKALREAKQILVMIYQLKFPDEIAHTLIKYIDVLDAKTLTLFKKNQPDSLMISSLPSELFPLIANHLPLYSLKKLLMTCGYFAHHTMLHHLKDEKLNQAFMIAVGSSHTLILHKDSGYLYGLGNNDKGQLGLDYTYRKFSKKSPRRIPLLGKSKAITAGYKHTLVIADNKLFGFGTNRSSQLGLGEQYHECNVFQPQEIVLPQGEIPKIIVTSNDALNSFSMVLCENNHLYVFGSNEKGELGLGDLTQRFTPTLNSFSPQFPIKEVIVGASHTFLITDDGVYGFGDNGCGQLGFGEDIKYQSVPKLIPFNEHHIKPIQISAGDYHTLILDKTGKVYGLGANGCSQLGLPYGNHYYTPTHIPTPNDESVTKIKAKAATSFIWCKHIIYAFGDNNHGQLGLGSNSLIASKPACLRLSPNMVLDIISSGFHTLIPCKANQLFAVGKNYYAQLGSGETGADQIKPLNIPLLTVLQNIIEEEEEEKEQIKSEKRSYSPI